MARLVRHNASGHFMEITPESFNGMEEFIRWSEGVPQRMRWGLDKLVFHMAIANQGFARDLSRGPSDPQQMNPGAAWKIPVRRITNRYYLGWKVKRLRVGVWALYNDSREAYFIEFGISEVGGGIFGPRHVPTRRIRRPVRKMSLRRTLEFLATTHVYHRVWADIYADPKRRHRGKGFTQIVQSPGVGGLRVHGGTQQFTPTGGGSGFSGPVLGRRLPR